MVVEPRIRTNYTNFLDADCADYAVFCHEMVRQAHHPERSRGKVQNAQKGQKNDQKSALFNRRSIRLLRQAQCKQAQDKFFVFSLTIATILYKYMHIYLWTALRIVVFERGL